MADVLKNTIGLDIRDSALTAVELRMEKDTFKVVNYSRVDLEPGIIDEDSILLNPEAFKEAVKKLLKEGREGEIKSANVIISVPEEKTFFHYLKIPVGDDNHEMILQHAKNFIPIELSEATIDYKRITAETNKKEIAFDFAAVQKSIIKPLIDALHEIDLRVVAIDVDKNSLMRVCQYCAKDKKSSMLIEINDERSLLSVRNDCGISHTLSLSLGEKTLLEKIKEDLSLESIAKAKSVLQEARGLSGEKNDAAQKIQALLNEFYETMVQKAQELFKLVQDEGCPEIEILFVVELGMKWPGLKEALKKGFPKAELMDRFECIKVGEEDQRLYFNAIGLALRAILPEAHEQEINLLPHDRKEELRASKIRPRLSIGFLLASLAIAGATVFLGIATGKIYFDYLVSQKELIISQEEIANPYLTEAAQASQQKIQMENQVKTILKDNIPASWLIRKIDSYNLNGIGLVNVGYQLGLDGNMSVNIRAKTASREETEKFIVKLDNDIVFSEVDCPLSNLVGKGERFIRLDIILDRERLPFDVDVSDEGSEQEEEKELDLSEGEEDQEGAEVSEKVDTQPAEDQPVNNELTQ